MKRIVTIVITVMLAILAIVPMTAVAESNGTRMYVNTSNGGTVRLRDLPGEAGKVLYNLGNGRPVTVVGEQDGWYEVKAQINGKTQWGYIMSQYVSTKDPSTARQSFKSVTPFTVKVTPASANGIVSMWDTTSKKNEHKVCDLVKGEKLTVTAQSKAWYQVVDAHGCSGYVAKAYVMK